jgi:hypothetical protein
MMRFRSRSALAAGLSIALAVPVALAIAVPAGASRKASAQQRRALTAAVQRTPVAGLNKIPKSNYRVTGQRISTVSRNWAIAYTKPASAHETTFQPGYVIAVEPAGTRAWVVVDAGSSMVGCGIAPTAVIADLLGVKKGQACPAGTGSGS